MDEQTLLLGSLRDRLRRCREENRVTYSNFLTVQERSLATGLCRETGGEVRMLFYGGYPEAERCAAFFLPAYLELTGEQELAGYLADAQETPFCLLDVKKDAFSSPTHRDYLGALMGLGVRRDMLGDILLREDGCGLFVMQTIASFIEQNLTAAGRASLLVKRGEGGEVLVSQQQRQEESCTVKSMRLDAVVAAVFHLSRNSAVEEIRRGTVSIDGQQIDRPDQSICTGSRLVLRGKGKVLLRQTQGVTKKERIRLIVERYL